MGRKQRQSMLDRFGTRTLGELGAALRLLDWNQIREEIEQENRARVVLIGPGNAGKSTLVNRLKGWALSQDGMKIGATTVLLVEDLGLFSLIDTPSDTYGNGTLETDMAWNLVITADLVVYILDGAAELRRADYEWYARIRAAGKPMLVVLNKCDLVCDLPGRATQLSHQFATPVVPISAQLGTNVETRLLPRLVEIQPALTTALGREVLAYRRVAAQRIARRAALLSLLIGGEPIPLLDIPFQAVTQAQMILRVAAVYGQPTGDRYSRELVATFASSAMLRFAAQQLAKLVPLAGWLVSAGIAGMGTWSLGQAAILYFERRTDSPSAGAPSSFFAKLLGALAHPAQSIKETKQWIGQRFSQNVRRVHARLFRSTRRRPRRQRARAPKSPLSN